MKIILGPLIFQILCTLHLKRINIKFCPVAILSYWAYFNIHLISFLYLNFLTLTINQVVVNEEKLSLSIFYNVNFGHAKPIEIIPYGILAELDCEKKTITFLERPTT